MSTSINVFDLRKQLAFYGAYHVNPINVAIHIVGVPTIIFGSEVLLTTMWNQPTASIYSHLPWLGRLSSSVWQSLPGPIATLFQHAELNYAAIFASLYWLYYFALDSFAATLLLPLWTAIYIGAMTLVHNSPSAGRYGLIAFAFGWISQFYGHGVHEGRAPALIDNLLGAVVLAPFFVWLEVIFQLGYRPQLQKNLHNDVAHLVSQFRKEKRAKAEAKKAK